MIRDQGCCRAGLNCLQSGLHKQHMKDLFVELCLTVPVRLSSLLPYLPMLMDPLVSALNGSQTLISQVRQSHLPSSSTLILRRVSSLGMVDSTVGLQLFIGIGGKG